MEITKLNLTELKRLQKRVEGEIERRASSAKKDVLKRVNKIVADAGLSLSDLIGGGEEKPARGRPAKSAKPAKAPAKKAGAKKTAGVAKYRNPDNAEMTWTGRGRKPLWVQNWLGAGKPLEELEIKG